ncbi:MAG: hypothetical protein JNM18_03690 [Planctomycetaceae bacterium]|nr:hypothetical protein [Planctomycetaceae bacterium]
MQAVGEALRAQQTTRIVLMHGTFVGSDAGGVFNALDRFLPGAFGLLGNWWSDAIKLFVGDRGNFTDAYAGKLQDALTNAGQTEIAVLNKRWGSENYHLGRANAAVALISELLANPPREAERVLFVGHSHAGNVFALMTQLLSGDTQRVQAFFDAARSYYEGPQSTTRDGQVWNKVRGQLLEAPLPFAASQLDFVTLGTPIRYSWHPHGFGKLLHVVFHRPSEQLPEYLVRFPPSLSELQHATGGDYVQALGIAGTDLPPHPIPHVVLANARLEELLQDGLTGTLREHWEVGQRVPDVGETLLVDYGDVGANILTHAAGHAVYTLESQMLFLFEQIVESQSRAAGLPTN